MSEPTPVERNSSPKEPKKSTSTQRDAARDRRIGLNMLGPEGRKLFFEYITIKQQHRSDKTP
jgi:hypothetical protein